MYAAQDWNPRREMNHYYGGGAGGLGYNHPPPGPQYGRFSAPRHQHPGPHSAVSNNTNSNDPKSKECRVFVGNLNPEFVSQRELEDVFGRHGSVLAISMHKGYAFVQYGTKEEAQRALEYEQGKVFASQPMDLNIVAVPNPNRPKGFKRVQNPTYYANAGYVDPSTLPVIPAANSSAGGHSNTGGPPAAKKIRRFMEQTSAAPAKESDEPAAWMCAYCKEVCTNCWALVKHVSITHQTRIYLDDTEQI